MSTWTHERSKAAILQREIKNGRRPKSDQKLVDEHYRNMRALRLADYIERTLAAAPPLTDEQRIRLSELLRPTDRRSIIANRLAALDGGAA
ncbi:hypothetical protein [Mycolicibacterium austroafricanum]|uniref:hypothetical protein n=1 Tax=Mycolicibacterium austroafricanum TaxID=39687 RepID=UPI001ABF16A1|nr:hypothetical protein [Mycolicibacterium austroafricanum]QRZ10186.1 hypothetical protein JN090_15900 [Mycolicibacterium austroafricanum]